MGTQFPTTTTTEETPKQLTAEQIRALFGTCTSPAALRDLAALLCMATGAARSSELIRVQNSDYDPGSGELMIKNKRFQAYKKLKFEGDTKVALDRWLETRGNGTGYLFCRIRPGDQVDPASPIFPSTLWWGVTRRLKEAGVESDLSPSLLRRACIIEVISNGATVAEAVTLIGTSPLSKIPGYKPVEDINAEFKLPVLTLPAK